MDDDHGLTESTAINIMTGVRETARMLTKANDFGYYAECCSCGQGFDLGEWWVVDQDNDVWCRSCRPFITSIEHDIIIDRETRSAWVGVADVIAICVAAVAIFGAIAPFTMPLSMQFFVLPFLWIVIGLAGGAWSLLRTYFAIERIVDDIHDGQSRSKEDSVR